jgi:hypothetical protein
MVFSFSFHPFPVRMKEVLRIGLKIAKTRRCRVNRVPAAKASSKLTGRIRVILRPSQLVRDCRKRVRPFPMQALMSNSG